MNIRSLHETLARKSPIELANEHSAMVEAMHRLTQRTAETSHFSNFYLMLDPAAALIPGENEDAVIKRVESPFYPQLRDNVIAINQAKKKLA